MVEGQYEAFIEEHLGVSNRNRRIVDLDGFSPLKERSIKSNLCTLERSFFMIIWVVPRKVSFRPF